jgi:alkylhydroperoxidase family enzyme
VMKLRRSVQTGDLGPPLEVRAAVDPATAPITIRPAYADDQPALARLAALDSAELPPSPVLIAEVDGELRAALAVADEVVIADPFFPTVHLAQLLRAHATATAPARGRRRYRYRLRYA